MEDDELSRVAMEVILNAGDGRQCIDQALEHLASFDFDGAEACLVEAEAKLLLAHQAQTDTIQRQAAGEDIAYSLLFTHAQDTLMTVSSALYMAQKMMPLIRALATK